MLAHGGALGGRRVPGADRHGELRRRRARAAPPPRRCRPGGPQVLLDVDGERPERRDVDDARPGRRSVRSAVRYGAGGRSVGPVGGVDGHEEPGQRLAGAGRRGNQDVPPSRMAGQARRWGRVGPPGNRVGTSRPPPGGSRRGPGRPRESDLSSPRVAPSLRARCHSRHRPRHRVGRTRFCPATLLRATRGSPGVWPKSRRGRCTSRPRTRRPR